MANISTAERHQIENEMLFRRMNEKVGDNLGELDALHIEEHELYLIRDEELLINFKCECSDENCEVRVPMKLYDYQTVHENRDTFIVKPNHQVDPIEKVIKKEKLYHVVQKNNSTPEPGKLLNVTSVDNSQKSEIDTK
jgi:hypothetical protein